MPVSALLVLALGGLAPFREARQATPTRASEPIAIEIGSSAVTRGGLLDLLMLSSDRDTAPTERAMALSIEERQWLNPVPEHGEVAVAIRFQQRNTGSRDRSKDGKRVSITFRYGVTAAIATARDRDTIAVEVLRTHSYSSSTSRTEPSQSEDRDGFEQAGRELGAKVRAWVLTRIEDLRPDGPDAGFRHKVRHKLLLVGDGLEVTEVDPEGPAYAAGLRVGDRIRRVDGEGNTTQVDERVLTWRLGPPGQATIEFERDKKQQTIVVDVRRRRTGSRKGPS